MALNGLHRAEKRYEVGRVFGEQEAEQRQLRLILNKLTPQNFELLLEQVLHVTLLDAITVPDFVLQIVGRAIGEPIYCEMYAELCYHIYFKQAADFSNGDKMINVKRLVVAECFSIFERCFRVVDEGLIKLSEEEREDDKIKAHIHMLGIVQFIGELFNKTMIPFISVHHCIDVLLEEYQDPNEKNIEALCLLITTAGKMLDDLCERLMDAHFRSMGELSVNPKLSYRVRLMVMDAIDLRYNEWKGRRKIERPTKNWELHLACEQQPEYHSYGFTTISQRRLGYNSPIPCVQNVFEEGLHIRRYEHIARKLYQSLPNTNSFRSSPPTGHGSREHELSPTNVVETQSSLTPFDVLHKAERRYEVGGVFGREDVKQRRLRSILNKLTFQNLGKLLLEVREVNVAHAITLLGFVSQIFDRVLFEPTYCELYASFCSSLADELPVFSRDGEIVSFGRILLNKCQEEFERKGVSEFQGHCQRLGNIQFIGALYKVQMLTTRILFLCIKTLLKEHQSPDEEDIEALCKLMSIIGEKIDHHTAKQQVDEYFDIMGQMLTSKKLSCRIRFMLMDVIDLRRNKWNRIRETEKLKKTEDVHIIHINGLDVIDLCSTDENDEDVDNHFSNSACLDVEVQRVEEDCYIFYSDPCQSLTTDLEHKLALTDDQEEDDICIISEKGQVACRDYPHSRHICVQYPFNMTNHENSCAQCYCYVCDERAPCELWEGKLGHCHASDKEHKWIDLRSAFRLRRKN